MDNNYLSVTELNTYIKNIIDSEDLLHRICVVGEVSGLSLRGPHAYFNLKDENSNIRCCSFNYKKTYIPKDGELVLVFGSLDFYHKAGYLSYNAIRIEPYGQGLLALKLEELKKKLYEKGYFSQDKKKEIPPFCQNIALITSKDGAVLHDIVRTIRSKNDVSNISFFDVKVQGIGCSSSIIDTLEKVDKLSYDVIIIARGGGSYEDLMGFNDERLVYAIFDAKTPIVSAVGHETDTTLCDFVADLRVPTPTAAGELFAYDIRSYKENLISNINFAYEVLKDKYEDSVSSYKSLFMELINAVSTKRNEKYNDIRLLTTNIQHSMNVKFDDIMSKIKVSIGVLNASNPINIMKRGFVSILNEKGSQIVGVKDMNVDDEVTLCAYDGSARARILEIDKEKK